MSNPTIAPTAALSPPQHNQLSSGSSAEQTVSPLTQQAGESIKHAGSLQGDALRETTASLLYGTSSLTKFTARKAEEASQKLVDGGKHPKFAKRIGQLAVGLSKAHAYSEKTAKKVSLRIISDDAPTRPPIMPPR